MARDLDLGSGHTAYRRTSLIDLYLHAKFHWNWRNKYSWRCLPGPPQWDRATPFCILLHPSPYFLAQYFWNSTATACTKEKLCQTSCTDSVRQTTSPHSMESDPLTAGCWRTDHAAGADQSVNYLDDDRQTLETGSLHLSTRQKTFCGRSISAACQDEQEMTLLQGRFHACVCPRECHVPQQSQHHLHRTTIDPGSTISSHVNVMFTLGTATPDRFFKSRDFGYIL